MVPKSLFPVLFVLIVSFIQSSGAAPAAAPGLGDFISGVVTDIVDTGKDVISGFTAPSDSSGTLDPKLLPNLLYFAEFAAAAYCDPEHVPGKQVTCRSNICPQVTKSNITTIIEFANTRGADTTGLVARDDTKKYIIVSFRGSHSLRNWLANVQAEPISAKPICESCKVHAGFLVATAEAFARVLDAVRGLTKSNPSYTVVCVGHSLGGAIATLTAMELRRAGIETTLYTFGAPRVGNEELSAHISSSGRNFRVTHTDDPVPRLPPVILGYRHVSPEYWISRGDTNIPASDIKIFKGGINRGGNGAGVISLNADAHLKYLLPVEISSCGASGFEF